MLQLYAFAFSPRLVSFSWPIGQYSTKCFRKHLNKGSTRSLIAFTATRFGFGISSLRAYRIHFNNHIDRDTPGESGDVFIAHAAILSRSSPALAIFEKP